MGNNILSHLRPRPCPPLGGTGSMVAGSPHLWTIVSAVFAVHHLFAAVVECLHTLHHPGLVAELPAGLAAGTPLFHIPSVHRSTAYEEIGLSFHN